MMTWGFKMTNPEAIERLEKLLRVFSELVMDEFSVDITKPPISKDDLDWKFSKAYWSAKEALDWLKSE